MNEAEKLFCEYMYEFTKKNWNKINKEKCDLTTPKNKFLDEVKTEPFTAHWVLTEVAAWAMDKVYLRELYVDAESEYGFTIIKINDKYIKFEISYPGHNLTTKFVEPKFKQVIYFE